MGFLLLSAATLTSLSIGALLGPPSVVCTFSDPRIAESSGLVASTRHPGVLWTHNDSGDSSRIFAVGADGRTRSTYHLAVAAARDWETMTSTQDARGRTVLWVGDIGDNDSARTKGVLVHRALEPATLKSSGTLAATSYRLVYDDGPHDAEAMFFGPDGRLRIVTKELFGGAVFLAPRTLSTSSLNVLHAIGDAPPLVTDGAELPGGGYALRDYGGVYLYDRAGSLRERDDLPSQPQGESLALSPDHRSLLIGSEGRRSQVLRMTLPVEVATPPAATPSASTSGAGRSAATSTAATTAGTAGTVDSRLMLATAALLALGGVGVVSGRRRRRHQ